MANLENFPRRAILQLDDARDPQTGRPSGTTIECGGPGGLDIDFTVRKTAKKGPNTASIQLYNPSREEALYAMFRDREYRVRLFAGYGDNLGLLFEGNPVKNGIEVIRQGPDRILKIEANDCLRKYQTTRVRFKIKGTTTLGEVLDRAVDQIGLPRGVIDVDRSQTLAGFRASGPVEDVLDRIAGLAGADWTFLNGKLELVKRSGAQERTGPLYSTAARNVYGWPSKRKDGISVVTQLDARMSPHRGFLLEMEEGYYNGAWRAKDVTHSGSTRGRAWENRLEAKRWR